MKKGQWGNSFYSALGKKYIHEEMESMGISYFYKVLTEISHYLWSHGRVGRFFVYNERQLIDELIYRVTICGGESRYT